MVDVCYGKKGQINEEAHLGFMIAHIGAHVPAVYVDTPFEWKQQVAPF